MADFEVPAYLAARASRQDSGRALMAATADYFRTFVAARQNRAQLDLQERQHALEEEKFRQQQQAIEEARREKVAWLAKLQPFTEAFSAAPDPVSKMDVLIHHLPDLLNHPDGVRIFGDLLQGLKLTQGMSMDAQNTKLIAMSAEHLLRQTEAFNNALLFLDPEERAEILKDRPNGWTATPSNPATQEEASAVYRLLRKKYNVVPVFKSDGSVALERQVAAADQVILDNIKLNVQMVENRLTRLQNEKNSLLPAAQSKRDPQKAQVAQTRISQIDAEIEKEEAKLKELEDRLNSLLNNEVKTSSESPNVPGGISYQGFRRWKGQ